MKKMKKSRGPSSCLDWVSDYTNSLVTNQVSDSLLIPAKFGVAKSGQKGCNLWGSDWEFHKILAVLQWVSKTVEVPNSTSFGLGIS